MYYQSKADPTILAVVTEHGAYKIKSADVPFAGEWPASLDRRFNFSLKYWEPANDIDLAKFHHLVLLNA